VPPAASASVLVEGWTDNREDRHFFRWYYDEAASKERMDGSERFLNEWYRTIRIIDAKAQTQWFVAFQESLVICETGKTNVTLPHPNFNNIRFIGKNTINFRVVDHWTESDSTGRDIAQIFSRDDNGEIVRIDSIDPRRPRPLVVHFYEFNAGTQDPSLWQLPQNILDICNQRP